MGGQLLSYSMLPSPLVVSHVSIPLTSSGAVFHHVDGSVEADRVLFHALK